MPAVGLPTIYLGREASLTTLFKVRSGPIGRARVVVRRNCLSLRTCCCNAVCEGPPSIWLWERAVVTHRCRCQREVHHQKPYKDVLFDLCPEVAHAAEVNGVPPLGPLNKRLAQGKDGVDVMVVGAILPSLVPAT